MMGIEPIYQSPVEQKIGQILMAALDSGDIATIKQTLDEWPSKPDAEHNSGNYDENLWPFKLVLSEDNPQIVSSVLDSGLKIELYAVLGAVDIKSIGVFQAFVDHGWDINEPLGETMPPALSYLLRHEPLVRWFLSHGASPNAGASLLARTPLTQAGFYAPLSIVKLLYANGATSHDILQTATESSAEGRLEIMEFVLDQGADINAVKWRHDPRSYADYEHNDVE